MFNISSVSVLKYQTTIIPLFKVATYLKSCFGYTFTLVPVTSLSQRERITVFRGNVMQKTLILLCPRLKSPQQSWTVKNDRSKTDSRLVHCHQAATKKEALASFLSNKKSLFKWVLHNAPFAEKRDPSWSPLSETSLKSVKNQFFLKTETQWKSQKRQFFYKWS